VQRGWTGQCRQVAHPQPLGQSCVSSWSLYRVGGIRSLSTTHSHQSIRASSSHRRYCKHCVVVRYLSWVDQSPFSSSASDALSPPLSSPSLSSSRSSQPPPWPSESSSSSLSSSTWPSKTYGATRASATRASRVVTGKRSLKAPLAHTGSSVVQTSTRTLTLSSPICAVVDHPPKTSMVIHATNLWLLSVSTRNRTRAALLLNWWCIRPPVCGATG